MGIVAAKAASSPVLEGGKPGPHKIQGISAGFIPKNYDKSVGYKIIAISDNEAFESGRALAQTEGLFIGISSGAAVAAAIKKHRSLKTRARPFVVILPDSGDRYLSTPLYHQD